MHISIGQPSTESTYATFRCPKGHEMVGNQPITFGWYGDIDRGPPICPHCLVEYVRTQFPMQRMTPMAAPPMMTPGILALAEGAPILRPTVIAGPCLTPGCILVAHPSNPTRHMNSAKAEFVTPE